MENYQQTEISQYATSPTITNLIAYIEQWIDPQANLNSFYDLIWNVDTAVGYGLDVWGRIVGVGRVVSVGTGSYFGFGEAGDRTGFDQSPFYDGQTTTENFSLTDAVYRQVIFAKAALNITDCSIEAINAILMNILFPGRGNAYVTDGNNQPRAPIFGFGEAGDREDFGFGPFGDDMPALPGNMTMTFVFDFVLQPDEIAIVTQANVLPIPTGVEAFYQYLT